MRAIATRGMPATILWVEDEQDLREILAEELADAGYIVVQAVNGRDALRCLRDCRPDLILCDIAMPVMDGYELLRHIRETRADLADIPFVFLSAQDGSGQITHGKYAGADDYLVKPVNFDLMLATIAARLRQVQRVRDKLAAEGGQAGGAAGAEGDVFGDHVLHRLARMLNLITAGVVLLGRDGRTQFANLAAQKLMLEGAGPGSPGTFSAGGLQGLLASSFVRDALQAGLNGEDHTEFLSLPRRNGQRDLLITICAMSSKGTEDDGPVAALFICADGRGEPAPLKALESLFKLTPAEGRVAWAFAQGLRPDQIAETFGVSSTTIAFHKRNIFQKTHTHRQADLIALLLTLPASVDAE